MPLVDQVIVTHSKTENYEKFVCFQSLLCTSITNVHTYWECFGQSWRPQSSRVQVQTVLVPEFMVCGMCVALHSGFWGDPGGTCSRTMLIDPNYTLGHKQSDVNVYLGRQRGEGAPHQNMQSWGSFLQCWSKLQRSKSCSQRRTRVQKALFGEKCFQAFPLHFCIKHWTVKGPWKLRLTIPASKLQPALSIRNN